MQRWIGWIVSAALLIGISSADAQPAVFDTIPVDRFVDAGERLERDRLWQQAAELYERAVRLHPQDGELRKRWRKAESLYSLSRRYHDESYVDGLLEVDEYATLQLYREVLRKIVSYHVEPADYSELVRRGYSSLGMALSESVFVEANVPEPSRLVAARLRSDLAGRPPQRILSASQAVSEVGTAARIARRHGISPTAVVLEFLTAACEGLDPYSAHLTPQRLKELYALIDGAFVGLGVEVRGDPAGLRILQVLPESPAADGGLRAGDRILAVGRRQLSGMDAEEAANLLQGREGSKLRLTVRSKAAGVRSLELVRRQVHVRSVTDATVLDEDRGIAFVRLSSFQKLTVDELDEAVSELRRKGMQAMILDLRGNPGGLLDVAVEVVNRFIDSGLVVRTRGPAWGQTWDHYARPRNAWRFDLAILVDGESASASEIVAGAIRDHQRGVIVGTRTFGKGSVQSIFPLRTADTGLRLTTARFFSPKDKAYEGIGVEPDILVARPFDGPLGEIAPIPIEPDLAKDAQLRAAYDHLRRNASLERRLSSRSRWIRGSHRE